MAALTLSELVTVETKQAIYARAISVATGLGLPVSSWSAGDETRSQYWVQAEELASYESIVAGYAAAGFLDYAAADADLYDWLVLLAYQVYGYTADEATYATTTVTLTNSLGGYFEPGAGDLTFKSSTSGKTYHNTSGGILASGPGTTLDVTVEADEAGSASSAAATEIDTLVTTMNGVTCSNAAAATGTDAESAESIVAGCRAKLGSLSPNGPADAYDYVACNATLTTTTAVTRSRTYDDSATGDVTVYLAGPSGAVAAGDVTLVTAAIGTWATPLCVTTTVASASNKTQAITYELWLYDSVGLTTAEVETAVSVALAALFLARPIGGDIKASVGSGFLYHSMIEGVFRHVFGAHFVDVAVTAPAADVAIAANEVPVLGAITVTAIHFEASP
jgi:hypothetical protein